MQYTEAELAALDLDWFGVDQFGQLAQFTTGGETLLPAPARFDRLANEMSLAEVEQLPATSGVVKLSPDRLAELRALSWESFFRTYVEMAARGTFAFTRLPSAAFEADVYRCVAAPTEPGRLSVRRLPSVTACKGRFELGVLVKVAPDGHTVWVDQS